MPGTGTSAAWRCSACGSTDVWWIVTPGNPLKDADELAPTGERVAAARRLANDPRIAVTAFEEEIGARYTVDTLAFLRRRFPRARFVWIMGADNLAGFHRWRGWRAIARMMPIAVIDRPGYTLRAIRSPAALWLGRFRIDEAMAPALAGPATAGLGLPARSPLRPVVIGASFEDATFCEARTLKKRRRSTLCWGWRRPLRAGREDPNLNPLSSLEAEPNPLPPPSGAASPRDEDIRGRPELPRGHEGREHGRASTSPARPRSPIP